jgi:heterotetrameric sarcosine oxidase gamma subunit
VWWLAGPLERLDETLDRTTTTLAEDGAATDMSGAFARLAIRGPHWRELLMIGGVFDAEDSRFAPGCTAGTVLHHTAVRYDVVASDQVILYVAPSYAADLLHHLRAGASRSAP